MEEIPISLSPTISTMALPPQQPEVQRPDHALQNATAQFHSQPPPVSQGGQLSGKSGQGRSLNRLKPLRPKVPEQNLATRMNNLRGKYLPSSSSRGSYPDQAKRTCEAKKEAKRTYETWTKEALDLLLEWLEKPNGYAQYRSAGKIPGGNGSNCASGLTKKHVRMQILDHLASNGIIKDDQQVKNKIDNFEKSYRSARSMLSTSRDGTTISEGGSSIRDKVLELYPLYDRLHIFMSKWVSTNPSTHFFPHPPFDGVPTQEMDSTRVSVPDSTIREVPEAQEYDDELHSGDEDNAPGSHHQDRAEAFPEGRLWDRSKPKSFVEVLLDLGEQYKEIEKLKMEKLEKYQKQQLDLQKKQLELQREQQRNQYTLQRQQQEHLFRMQEKQLDLEFKRAEAQKLESDARLKEIVLRQQQLDLEITQKKRASGSTEHEMREDDSA